MLMYVLWSCVLSFVLALTVFAQANPVLSSSWSFQEPTFVVVGLAVVFVCCFLLVLLPLICYFLLALCIWVTYFNCSLLR